MAGINHDLLKELKAQAPRKKHPVALRLPEELHQAIESLQKQTGATYTAVLVKLLELGLKVFKGK